MLTRIRSLLLILVITAHVLTGNIAHGAVKMKLVSTEEAQELLKKGYVAVNCMPKASFDDCTIKDSINITILDKEKFKKEVMEQLLGKNIMLFCAFEECPVSVLAHAQLKLMEIQSGKMLWGDIVKYDKGVREWHKAGLPTTGECKKDYLQIPPDEKEPAKKEEAPQIEKPQTPVEPQIEQVPPVAENKPAKSWWQRLISPFFA